jgi:DNA modification methylase
MGAANISSSSNTGQDLNGVPVPGGNGFAVSRDLNPKLTDVSSLKPLGRETRKHPAAQVRKLQSSLEQFGVVLPVVVDAERRVVAGWGLVLAAKKMGLLQVPAVTIDDLGEAKLRLLRLALNRLGEESSWDFDALTLEFSDILEIDVHADLQISGFEMGEIDVAFARGAGDEEDDLQALDENATPVAKLGDLWLLGDHRILCGDALALESYKRLLGEELAQMVFADPPWNIPIAGNVSGLGTVKHDDFIMACGEMSATQFESFLRTALGNVAAHSVDGSIHYVCMGWSKMRELLAATDAIYSELKNLCVWCKPNGGMGSLYRSRHELVFVFKQGLAPHINNIELGRYGRNRSNLWDYPSQNVLNGTSKSKLALHPTPKPVGLVADAIRDCSHRNGIILDPFGGAGSTLIAAERTGRKARLIELEPRFVDAAIKRWQTVTGKTAVKASTGSPYGLGDQTTTKGPTPSEAAGALMDGAQ